jgi:hypothetical protein
MNTVPRTLATKNGLLHPDNAPFFTWEFFVKNMTVFPHPPYSPDLAHLQLFCFSDWR